MRRESSSIFINAFLDLPQLVSASHCHHQGVVVSSEATQVVCMVDVYGLRPVQNGQLSRVVTKRVQWVQFLWSLFVDKQLQVVQMLQVKVFPYVY
jgi:hypothetical protein